jgi:hypothetical protein
VPSSIAYMLKRMRRTLLSLATIFTLVTAASSVRAQAENRTENRAEAATRFDEGTKAFESGDFRRAAESFDVAYRLAPNVDTLWNAARAWHRAGETARAATLYARYLRDAPPTASDRAAATAQLAALSPKLARIEVHGDDLRDLRIDAVPSEDRVVYVSRGAHVVSATVGGKAMRKDQQVGAGDVVSVVFDEASLPPSPPEAHPPLPAPGAFPRDPAREPEPGQARHKGWSPWVFAGGAFLTSVAVGFTIASGVDTLDALSAFNAKGTQSNLSSGTSKQLRTNVLLGTSVGLGALTAATGIWLVDWHPGVAHVEVGITPVGGGVRWGF